MRAFYCDHFVLPLPPGHRFPMQKYGLLRDRVAAELPQVRLEEAQPASDGELALAHHPRYVSAVAQGWLTSQEQREIGFPWSPAMAERARRSVGATIAAARAALDDGVGANLAGGTHHAYADRGGGFCVFNDVAVAARLMQAEWHRRHRALLRVLVLDLDVHQGNGTAAIFADDPTVYTVSLHGQRNFPFRKERSDLDVELADGCTDEPYLDALDEALRAVWRHHENRPPGLVFYLAGADPHEGDRLGRLKVSAAGLAERDRRVFASMRERGVPVVVTMAGGYGHDIHQTVAIQLETLRIAQAVAVHPRSPAHPHVETAT
ncbi:histone deacetylase family protein [Caldimonas aquatica]|uniref:Histone deacetylase n=1 Tax=Caldimonas aquatica TaxID=376175 RepID=A0ABY6MW60_9BURK|nr:histone deacetylase [Schlegelella aquatica]UZD56237.1 histone deacetylase [Schlegelella aquatica]